MIVDYARLVIEADSRGVRTAADDIEKLNSQGTSAKSVFAALKPVLVAVGAALSVRQIIDYTDRWTDLNARLLNATKDSDAAGDALNRISDVARRTYSSLEITAEAFLRNNMTLTELGYTTNAQLDLMEALNNALVISGTKGRQAESVMDALSKAFAFGELRGQNFNTVIQSGGRIVEALAAGLGVTTLELRSMAADGLLPTGKVVEALTSQLGVLRQEADRMPATIGDGFLLLKNSMLELVGTMNDVTGASGMVSSVLVGAADKTRALALSIRESRERNLEWNRTFVQLTETIGGQYTPTIEDAVKHVTRLIDGKLALVDATNLSSRSITTNAEVLETLDQLYGESARQRQRHTQIVGQGNAMQQMLNSTVREAAERKQEETKAHEENTDAVVEATKAYSSAFSLLNRERNTVTTTTHNIEAQRESVEDLISSLSVVRLSYGSWIDRLNDTKWTMQGVTEATDRQAEAVAFWTKVSEDSARRRTKAEEEAAREQREMLRKTHEFMTQTLLDIWDNSDNVFKKIGDSFVAMVKRMVAEWAASGLMRLVGLGGPAAPNPFTAVAQSTVGQAVGSVLGGGAGGVVAGAGTAIKGAVSSVTGFAAANPILAGAAVAGIAAAALATKPTPSTNAGLLIHDAAGVSADRKFSVTPFDSGFAPIGFARREEQAAAAQVIDAFREYDSALTEIARAAGLNVNFSNNPFGGFDEKGQGSGLFLGVAAEAGKATGAALDQQLTHFTKQWVEALGGQVAPDDRAYLLAATSADDLIRRAAELGSLEVSRIHGSHYNGLDRVPFNGYMAQLHAGERVLTASEADAMDRMGMGDMVSIMKAIAQHTAKTARQLERWNFDGLPEERVFA